MSKSFRRSLGLSGLFLVLACGSKPPKDTTTIGNTGGTSGVTGESGGAGTSGLPGDLFPTSNVDGGAGAAPGETPADPRPSVAEVPVGSSVAGTTCQTSTECSSLSCQGGNCSTTACVSDGAACSSAGECCGGNCDNGLCAPLNLLCKTSGNACTEGTECCSALCADGVCSMKSSFCTQSGDVCGRDAECCTGSCTIAQGATVGSCAPPPAPGASNCSGGVDGSLCDGCGTCCSRLCAPFGDSGVNICQPANGCHVNGDLCREDSDCCGATGTGLPGDGNVTCEKEEGHEVGVCRNPTGCNPQGNVCHFQDYVCSISSSRNNCCGATGNSGACQLDPLGVPRCDGLGGVCRPAGETCASSMDCCDGRLCVPDAEGQLRCSTSENPTACVPSGGGCSVSGDCCLGILCNVLPGSTRGTCGSPPSGSDPTPGSGGTTGDPGSGGTSGTGDPPPEPTYSCGLYGQQCGQNSDCCGDVPCTGGICVTPIR